MRVLHVSWEYPPIVYGGLGRHVQALTQAQAARGDDVTVLTQTAERTMSISQEDGIRVIRAPHDPPEVPFGEATLLAWVLGMQTGMIRAAAGAGTFDVIHAHDWVTAHAGIALRDVLGARALVATIHATEAGRHQGWLPGPLSDAIHSIEHWLAHQADGVITCSHHMRDEVVQLFSPRPDQVSVIANGIDMQRWSAETEHTAHAREIHAPTGPLVVFVGRLEWEKGAQTLIDALPRLRRRIPGLRAVIDNHRLAALPEVARQFRQLANSVSGSADALIQSAFPISPAELDSLKTTLEKRFGRRLEPSVQVDPDLIGGVRVVVGDEVLDTSVKARLEQMKMALTA